MLVHLEMTEQLGLWEYPGMDRQTGSDFYARLMEAFADMGERPTQMQIAEYCGLQQPAVSKWKSGESFPEFDVAKKLAQRARCNVVWLYLGIGNKKNEGDMDEQTTALLDAWQGMPESARAELLEYIRFRAEQERQRMAASPPVIHN